MEEKCPCCGNNVKRRAPAGHQFLCSQTCRRAAYEERQHHEVPSPLRSSIDTLPKLGWHYLGAVASASSSRQDPRRCTEAIGFAYLVGRRARKLLGRLYESSRWNPSGVAGVRPFGRLVERDCVIATVGVPFLIEHPLKGPASDSSSGKWWSRCARVQLELPSAASRRMCSQDLQRLSRR